MRPPLDPCDKSERLVVVSLWTFVPFDFTNQRLFFAGINQMASQDEGNTPHMLGLPEFFKPERGRLPGTTDTGGHDGRPETD